MPKGQLDSKVTESLEKHSLWLKGDPRGERLVLSSVAFDDVDFSHLDLRGALLHDVAFKRTSFQMADLRGAVLSWSLINDCSIEGALLHGADLTWTDTTGTPPAFPLTVGDLVTVLDGEDTPAMLVGFARLHGNRRNSETPRAEILLPDGKVSTCQSAQLVPARFHYQDSRETDPS